MTHSVGVLALQGDVPEHLQALSSLRPPIRVVPVRTPEDLAQVDALFLPGGESTTIARLLEASGLWGALRGRLGQGLPVLATCAGMILLARELEPAPTGADPPTFGVLDVKLRRNDYGRQRESFEAPVRVEGLPGGRFPGIFIRSPRLLSVGAGVESIAFLGKEVVGVRVGPVWGLAFHPELSGDLRLHRRFLAQVFPQRKRGRKNSSKATARRPRPKGTAQRGR